MIKKIFYKAVYKKYVSLPDSRTPYICNRSNLFSFFWRIKIFRTLIKKDAERFLNISPFNIDSFSVSVIKESAEYGSLFKTNNVQLRKEFLYYMAFGELWKSN